jgi:hypothetical protein
MRSRADVRVWVERALRAASLGILAMMLWRSVQGEGTNGISSVQGTASLAELRVWSTTPIAPPEARVTFDSVPQPVVRDWLRGLRRAGTVVGWTGKLPPIAVTTSSIPSPAGGTAVLVAAPRGSTVEVRDDIGPFDTVIATGGGARFVVHADGPFIVHDSNGQATARRSDSSMLRRVLILGDAGWEAKFASAALEEAGWKVDAMIHVAPGVDVSQNAGYHIDTARYSAVIALGESTSPWATAIDEYVRSGGGAIIGPDAAGRMSSALRAGTAGTPITPTAHGASETLASIPLSPLQALRPDVIVIERRGDAVAVAARRHFAGRVIQIGYPESWRWRMGGDERAMEDHRNWWSGLVSAAAYAPRVALPVSSVEADGAPLAALVSAIGPALPSAAMLRPLETRSHSMVWLAILLAFTVLTEIASRRLRGAK